RLAIRSLGICGVMHGIVWWRCSGIRQAMCELLSERDSGIASAKTWPWSTYITFLDQRCTPSMLTKWRAKIQLANTTATAIPFGIEALDVCASTSPIASGYGLATFAYMMERRPHDIIEFDACGTIQDFVAYALCGHSIPAQNCMDVTDAFSWGGFDINTKTWNHHTVQALGLPAHMLPAVKAPGAIIGQSSDVAAVLGLPHGKPVYLAMGDHPCAVMTTIAQTRGPADLNLSRTSVLSIGSASQLAMVLTEDDATQLKQSRGSCSLSFEVRPFLSENWYLGVAGSLSGGNIFAWFVKQCQAWSRQLAVDPTAEHLSDDATYARLISLGGTKLDTDLRFSPTLYGEWASPDVRGSIEQLRISNWSLGDISASICRGLVDNIFSMVPEDLRTDLLQQPLLKYFLGQKLAHPSQLSIQSTADAAVGVAFIPSLLQK
ncbi:SedoheptuloKinase-like protein, partial [Phytophthora palmivora]